MPYLSPPKNTSNEAVADLARKFVRIKEKHANGLVVFDFSIGWPEQAVELVLPQAAFDEFCVTHQVQHLANE